MKDGDTVVVLGCGPVGLLAQKFAWLKEAKRVIAVDYLDYRLQHAKTYNKVETVNFEQHDNTGEYLKELLLWKSVPFLFCPGNFCMSGLNLRKASIHSSTNSLREGKGMAKKIKAAGKFALALAACGIWISGCSLLPEKQPEKIDPHQSVSVKDGTKQTATAKKGQVLTELYLIDKNGYVVPQTIALPESKSIAKQALEYLVQDGPVSNLLPNGFRAVLPANTQLSVDVKDGLATVDFSGDFKDYQAHDEQKILESVTWTLTQFDSIQKVSLKMNGKKLKAMPVAGTPVSPGGLTREAGINTDTKYVADITNTHPVTVYYLAETGGQSYYVPVTKRVADSSKDDVAAAVEELVKGPSPGSHLVSGFMDDVKLKKQPEIANGKVTLDFNKEILGSLDKKMISNEVLDPLVLTLTEQKGIKSVAVEVDGSTKVVTEDGKSVSEPVTRPEKVNTGSF